MNPSFCIPRVSLTILMIAILSCVTSGDPQVLLSAGYIADEDQHDLQILDVESPQTQSLIRVGLKKRWFSLYPSQEFKPDHAVSREAFAYVLWKFTGSESTRNSPKRTEREGSPALTGVSPDRWARPALDWLLERQIVPLSQPLLPEAGISRSQAFEWAFKAMESSLPQQKPESRNTALGVLFGDADPALMELLAQWTAACPQLNLGSDHPALFAPDQSLSRMHMAQFFHELEVCLYLSASPDTHPGSHHQPEGLSAKQTPEPHVVSFCDVIVHGGTLAAIAASLATAESDIVTCLIEPLPQPGGLWLSRAEPISRSPHLPQSTFGQHSSPTTRLFRQWVRLSRHTACNEDHLCYFPFDILKNHVFPLLAQTSRLHVFTGAQVVHVETEGNTIESVTVHQSLHNKRALSGHLHSKIPSEDENLPDTHQTSRLVTLRSARPANGLPIIEANPIGDILVLSRAEWRQGLEGTQTSVQGADQCGEALVLPAFFSQESVKDLPNSAHKTGIFSGKEWSQAEIKALFEPKQVKPNFPWHLLREASANVYAGQFYLASRLETESQIDQWDGGLNHTALEYAEEHFKAWMRFKTKLMGRSFALAPDAFWGSKGYPRIAVAATGRRSVGLASFALDSGAEQSDTLFTVLGRNTFQGLQTCSYPGSRILSELDGKPLPLPYRAFTNARIANLILAGPNLATDFYIGQLLTHADAEWLTGSIAAAMAKTMIQNQANSTAEIRQELSRIRLQAQSSWESLSSQEIENGQTLPR